MARPAPLGIVTGICDPCLGILPITPVFYLSVNVTKGGKMVAREKVPAGTKYWLSVPAGTYQIDNNSGEPPFDSEVTITGGHVVTHEARDDCY